jgi:hypothetical protein
LSGAYSLSFQGLLPGCLLYYSNELSRKKSCLMIEGRGERGLWVIAKKVLSSTVLIHKNLKEVTK